MTADEYLRDILSREAVDSGPRSALRALAKDAVEDVCRGVVGDSLLDVYPAGGFEKGTTNRSGLSVDLLVSLTPKLQTPIAEVYEAIFTALDDGGLQHFRRDISVATLVGDIGVDIIPARREAMTTDVHEFWLSRPGRPIKTNLTQHILDTAASGRAEEIRVLKLWREQHELDFPSFYLELTVRAALRKSPQGELAANVWTVLGYLESLFPARSVVDPANANNIVSDLLGQKQRDAIRKAAAFSRAARAWTDIVA